jgi:hypothetical protein
MNINGKGTLHDCKARSEYGVESVKAIRYRTDGVRNAVFEVAENSGDWTVKSEAEFCVNYEL